MNIIRAIIMAIPLFVHEHCHGIAIRLCSITYKELRHCPIRYTYDFKKCTGRTHSKAFRHFQENPTKYADAIRFVALAGTWMSVLLYSAIVVLVAGTLFTLNIWSECSAPFYFAGYAYLCIITFLELCGFYTNKSEYCDRAFAMHPETYIYIE